MQKHSGTIEDLNGLLEELSKETPNTTVLKARMKSFGLNYSSDPVRNMQKVLERLDGPESETGARRENGQSL